MTVWWNAVVAHWVFSNKTEEGRNIWPNHMITDDQLLWFSTLKRPLHFYAAYPFQVFNVSAMGHRVCEMYFCEYLECYCMVIGCWICSSLWNRYLKLSIFHCINSNLSAVSQSLSQHQMLTYYFLHISQLYYDCVNPMWFPHFVFYAELFWPFAYLIANIMTLNTS